MQFDFFLFGVPTAFQIYPNSSADEYEYYIQFYDGSTEDWKLVIQRNQNIVRYTYLRYRIISGVNRAGSFIGFSLKFDSVFCTDPESLLRLFSEVYTQQLKEQHIIKYNDGGKTAFAVNDLERAKDKIKLIRDVLAYNLDTHFKETFSPLNGSFLPGSANIVYKMSRAFSNQQVNEKIKEYAAIEILPPSAAGHDVPATEVPTTIGSEELKKFIHLPLRIKEYTIRLQSKCLDIFQGAAEESNSPQKKVELVARCEAFIKELEVPFLPFSNDIARLRQKRNQHPDHPYLKELVTKYSETIKDEEEKIKELSNKVAGLKKKMLSADSDEVPATRDEIPQLQKTETAKRKRSSKKIFLVSVAVLAVSIALYTTVPDSLLSSVWPKNDVPGHVPEAEQEVSTEDVSQQQPGNKPEAGEGESPKIDSSLSSKENKPPNIPPAKKERQQNKSPERSGSRKSKVFNKGAAPAPVEEENHKANF